MANASTQFSTLSTGSRAGRNGFTAQQRQVMNLLAQGASATTAAAETGVHRTTINHWQRTNPLFLLELERARQEIGAKLRDQYLALAPLAMDALRDLLANPKTPAATRLKAITVVLNAAMAEVDPAYLHPSVESAIDEAAIDEAAIHQHSSLFADEEPPAQSPLEPGDPRSGPTGPEPDSSTAIHQHSSPRECAAHATGQSTCPTTRLEQFFVEMEESLNAYGDLESQNSTLIHQNSSQSRVLPSAPPQKTGRNEPCPCGSGQKYKRCCLR